jgi:hypothetical protein
MENKRQINKVSILEFFIIEILLNLTYHFSSKDTAEIYLVGRENKKEV